MITSNAAGTPTKRYNLDDLGAIMMRRDRVPFGFVVSRALWEALVKRFLHEAGDPLAAIPSSFQGIRTVVDPTLEATQFDVAFNEEAWTKRLAEIRSA